MRLVAKRSEFKRRESKRRAVFLDRDGVINALVYHEDAGVIDSPMNEKQLKMLPRVPKAIRLLNEKGFLVIVVSNQAAVARGRFSMEVIDKVEYEIKARLAKAGARIDAAYYCVHQQRNNIAHPYAKPQPLLFLQ